MMTARRRYPGLRTRMVRCTNPTALHPYDAGYADGLARRPMQPLDGPTIAEPTGGNVLEAELEAYEIGLQAGEAKILRLLEEFARRFGIELP